jgi:hypothetical protein
MGRLPTDAMSAGLERCLGPYLVDFNIAPAAP